MRNPAQDVFVGLDLGTSSLKAVAVASNGDVVARASEPYPTHRPEPQASEQDPAAWIAALDRVLRHLCEQVSARRWATIGLSAMIPTLVLTDTDGVPIGRAVTWEDARAESEGSQLREQLSGDWLYQETGQWIDGRYLLPMLLRIQSTDSATVQNARWMLGAKDYLFWYLTRTRATDPSTAAGFGCFGLRSGEWLEQVLEAAAASSGMSMPRLPTVRPSTHSAALAHEVVRELPIPAGLPVVLGAADSVLAALGLGARDDGDVAYVAGTSTVILGVSESLVADPAHRFLVTPMAVPGTWGLEMDQLATGSAMRWLAQLLGVSESDLTELAAASTSDRPPLFLPYLAPGEQGALWDPSLTGSISGLTLQHNAADLARGLLTGVILESRRSLDVLADMTGTRGDIRITGWGASSPLFRQDLADATGRSVIVSPGLDHSAVGAAMLSAHAVGAPITAHHAGGAVRASRPLESEPMIQIVRPDVRAERLWADRFAAHDAALEVTRGLQRRAKAGGLEILDTP